MFNKLKNKLELPVLILVFVLLYAAGIYLEIVIIKYVWNNLLVGWLGAPEINSFMAFLIAVIIGMLSPHSLNQQNSGKNKYNWRR